MPIVLMAVMDRDLPRDYVLRNPQVYASGPNNEFLSLRMTLRWVVLTIVQTVVIYEFSASILNLGGGVTSAFLGLMGNWGRNIVGDGEGGDLQVFGTTIYSQLIFVVSVKVSYSFSLRYPSFWNCVFTNRFPDELLSTSRLCSRLVLSSTESSPLSPVVVAREKGGGIVWAILGLE